jgi:hypothetical protein
MLLLLPPVLLLLLCASGRQVPPSTTCHMAWKNQERAALPASSIHHLAAA